MAMFANFAYHKEKNSSKNLVSLFNNHHTGKIQQV
jgi:hypothetical protein